MSARLDRISRLVDRELTLIEESIALADAPPVDLDRLEVLARLVRQLDLKDGPEEIENPYAGLPANLLREVMKHVGPKAGEHKDG